MTALFLSPAEAAFEYVAPPGERPRLSILEVTDRTALSQVLARLTPPSAVLRYDRRVDATRRITRPYPDWQSLLFGEGLAFRRAGEELHIYPAGLATGEIELAGAFAGRSRWRIDGGESLRAVLERWGERAGVRVVYLTDRDMRLGAPAEYEGTFMEAVGALIFGLAHLPRPPVAEASPDGRTLSVTHRLAPTQQGEPPARPEAAPKTPNPTSGETEKNTTAASNPGGRTLPVTHRLAPTQRTGPAVRQAMTMPKPAAPPNAAPTRSKTAPKAPNETPDKTEKSTTAASSPDGRTLSANDGLAQAPHDGSAAMPTPGPGPSPDAAPARPETPNSTSDKTGKAGYAAWIGSMQTPEGGRRLWTEIRQDGPDVSSLPAYLWAVVLSGEGRQAHRLVLGPWPERAEAEKLCARFAKKKLPCLVAVLDAGAQLTPLPSSKGNKR